MGNNLFPEKDYIGLGDGPLESPFIDQGYGAALESAIGTGTASSPIIGTAKAIATLPPLALDKWVPPIGQDSVRPLFTVRNPDEVAAQGDKLFESEKELQGYTGYNPNIKFEPGMTRSRYDAQVQMHVDQMRRDAATQGHPFTNIFGQIIGGAPDPSNYIPIFGELGNAWKLGKGARLGWNIVKSGGEGGVGSVLADAALTSKKKSLGEDVSLKASLETAAMGFLIGSVFGTIGHSISSTLSTKTPAQTVASRTIVQSPLNPKSAEDAVAVLADAYDSFMTNNGLATPYYAGGKGGPIQFGSNSVRAFTEGMEAAKKSVDLNWVNLIYRRKNEMEPLPGKSMEEKYTTLENVGFNRDTLKREYELLLQEKHIELAKDTKGQYERAVKDYNQLKQELDDYNTIEVDHNVISRIIDDPVIKQRLIGSQIRDATGKPITLFIGTPHGTDTRLSMDKAGSNVGGQSAKMTLWATDNPHDASGYSLDRYLNSRLDKFEDEIPLQQPSVRPILLDMKNPMIVDYKEKGYDDFRHVDNINRARELGHDGVIFKNIVDTPPIGEALFKDDLDLMAVGNKAQTPSTHYAIFDPKQIIDLQDVSTDFSKVIDQQQAYLDARANKPSTKFNALDGSKNEVPKGYNYDSQASGNLVINDVAQSKFIDIAPVLAASKKEDDVKYQEVSAEAAGLDIEAKTTGFEDEMELALAAVPITPQEEAFALKVDQDIAIADHLEVFMRAAIKCIE